MARVNCYPKYKSYRNRYGFKKPVEDLLNAFGINLISGGVVNELEQFQNYLSDYKIIVYDCLTLSLPRYIPSVNPRCSNYFAGYLNFSHAFRKT